MRESEQQDGLSSNSAGRKFAPKYIRRGNERISFRELAKFAASRKTIEFLCERTGCDPSTAKRWLSGQSRVPDQAVYAVCASIFTRLG